MSKLIVGNWKMHMTVKEAISLAKKLKPLVKKTERVVVCPPFTALYAVKEVLKNSSIRIGAQNMHYEDKGAYTGEIAPAMLKELCDYVIVGHSERRKHFNETNELINKKVTKALEYGLTPILCIGEKLEEREDEQTLAVLGLQTEKGLEGMNKKDVERIIIAYEPVWAIGTGMNATPEQAAEAHNFIRKLVQKLYSVNNMTVLYGGSVNSKNAALLLHEKTIDGALVGGASLDAQEFVRIVRA